MLKTIRIVAPFHNIGGYSHAARGLLAAALLAGFTVEAVESETIEAITLPLDGSPVKATSPRFPGKPIPACQVAEMHQALRTTVAHDAPTILMGNPGIMAEYPEYCAGPRIGYTMLESDTLQPQWAQACRNVDLLLAPSTWCVDTMRRCVPGVPVELLPICVDERLWSPEGPKRMISHGQPPFLFLSIFSTCERKGWRKTIQAFAEEFRGENVGLVLKPTRVAEVEELADWARSMGARIEIIKGELTDYEMACLYRACDVYVSPSAEGYGNPLVEAALCGLPSVALAAGGTADIVTDANGYPIPAEWEPCVGQLPQIYPSSHSWPTCTIANLRLMMRTAYHGEQDRLPFAIDPREFALDRFDRVSIGETLLRVLAGVKPIVPEVPFSTPHRFIAVITTHNNLKSTNRLVQSLLSDATPYMIVIADDGSTDDTQDWAVRPGFLFVGCNTGGNVSQNRQLAVNALKRQFTFAEDPYIVFLDNDVEVSSDWWENLSSIMDARPDIGILAPMKMYGADTQASAPQFDAPDADTVQNVGNRLYFNAGSFPVLLERPLVYPDYVESACMVVRPEVWRSLEWDAQFPIFYEDVDYCFQARAAGFEVCATNLTTVTHHAHTTSNARSAEAEINRMRFLKKWKDRL